MIITDEKTAFIFPGQGAQTVGMAKDIVHAHREAAQLFEKAGSILGYDLADICFHGPEEKLNATSISQPAIFLTSAAILEVLKTKSPAFQKKPAVTAGLSLGEYTALYAAGVMTFDDALTLVQKRASAMQAAADASAGAMVTILGLDEEKAIQLCSEAAQGDLLVPANFNCPGQIVLSGELEPCSRAVELAEKYGAIKAVKLKVAGAFHTSMMTPAANSLAQAISSINIRPPANTRIIANINAQYYTSPQQIADGLTTQLVQPIFWQKCMEKLLTDGIEQFYEIGPGRVLTGLMKKISRKTKVFNISDLQSLDQLI
ncbi:MAG: ACP S-malonyltransferase [Planctomycetota bacterium]